MILSDVTIATQMFEAIQKDFKFPLKDRLHIAPETKLYRVGEDVDLWNQARTSDYQYHVFWDGEFICFLNTRMTKEQLYLDFWRGFQKAYEEHRIFINPKMYEIKEQERKAKEKAELEAKEAAAPKATTKEEKLVKEAVRRAKVEGKKKKIEKSLIVTKSS